MARAGNGHGRNARRPARDDSETRGLLGQRLRLEQVRFVAVILSALRWATTLDIRRHRTTTPDVGTALDVLNARYARGEIDRAEYLEKRASIGSRTGGES